jgi:hypothetical protein
MFEVKETEWREVELFIEGVKITKVQGIQHESSQEKELLYAAGNEPIGIQRGNRSYSGTLTLLKGQVDAINRAVIAAGGTDLMDASFTIVINYIARANRATQVDTLFECEFTSEARNWSQNQKFLAIDLPFIFTRRVTV